MIGMPPLVARLMLGAAALGLGADGVMHAAVWGASGMAAARASNLPAMFGAELGVLWLWDAVALVGLALVFLFAALRPAAVSGPVIMLLALIPALLAAILYWAVGPFYPELTVGIPALLALAAGAMMMRSKVG